MNTHTYTAELAAPQTKYADTGKPMTVCIIVNGIDVRHDCENQHYVKQENAMNIPGLVVAKHAIITSECRQNRGSLEALEEALDRLRCEAKQCFIGWPKSANVRFHLILAVERQPPEELPRPCRWCGRIESEHGEPVQMVADAQGRKGRPCPVPDTTSQYYAPRRD